MNPTSDDLREALKTVAVVLKGTGRPFALAGGYAAWAHGAPESINDVDFLVRAEDAEELAAELAAAGLTVVQPPEDWLFKVPIGPSVVDVIHRSLSATVEGELERAESRGVLSVEMPVVSVTDLVSDKLLALTEHYCDVAAVLPVLRALREQVDWPEVVRRAEGHPFAEAVLFLLDRLEVVPGVAPAG
ncbi:hypothetical protein [Nocardioides sp. SYSU D00038]|uniref:hypothetical protein n=1 Tax=Nocardioides sp. SYSU D00038 TaxID=2812554 RepID=UPI001F075A16|nr:hypothetical protein [Nocardioides sp. SYSU D00038]